MTLNLNAWWYKSLINFYNSKIDSEIVIIWLQKNSLVVYWTVGAGPPIVLSVTLVLRTPEPMWYWILGPTWIVNKITSLIVLTNIILVITIEYLLEKEIVWEKCAPKFIFTTQLIFEWICIINKY